MLETINDYLSFLTLLILLLAAIRVLLSSLLNVKKAGDAQQILQGIFYFSDNEEE